MRSQNKPGVNPGHAKHMPNKVVTHVAYNNCIANLLSSITLHNYDHIRRCMHVCMYIDMYMYACICYVCMYIIMYIDMYMYGCQLRIIFKYGSILQHYIHVTSFNDNNNIESGSHRNDNTVHDSVYKAQ